MLVGKWLAYENMTKIETLDNSWFRVDKYNIVSHNPHIQDVDASQK